MSQIVLASGNPGKVREINALITGLDLQIIPQSTFNVENAEETGLTFVENAIIKARHAAQHSGLPAIADDSGIEVDALNGAPGIHSARYAGVGASDKDNLTKLIEAIEDVPDEQRTARFICVMVYMRYGEDPTPIITQGVWEGRLLRQAVGDYGFGYDPVFYVKDHQCSSAQLDPELKNQLSHRGQALRKLIGKLQTIFG